jgi:DNA polymerase-3 subunit epsilon
MFFHSPDWETVVYWALDLETGGLNAQSDAILAVGMVPVREGTIRLGEGYRTLVQPGEGKQIQASSIQAHQLVPQELMGGPPLATVLDAIEDRVREGVLLVHQASVDVAFLQKACKGLGRKWPKPAVVDTVDLLLKLAHKSRFTSQNPEQVPELNLSEARRGLGLPPYPAHDPLTDAMATAELFLVLRHKLGAKKLRDLT